MGSGEVERMCEVAGHLCEDRIQPSLGQRGQSVIWEDGPREIDHPSESLKCSLR